MLDPGTSRFAILLIAMGISALASAHDSPSLVIDHLTYRMSQDGFDANLLIQRAVEYRIVREPGRARTDLEHALRLHPKHIAALLELARLHLSQNRHEQATKVIEEALGHVSAPRQRAACLMTRAEIRELQGDLNGALSDCEEALRCTSPEIDWFLIRTRLYSRMGDLDACVDSLRDAMSRNPSIVIENAFVDALIDAGKFTEALPWVEAGLRAARWKSTWLIRSARILAGQGAQAQARSQFEAALTELESRLHPTRPDRYVMAEKDLVLAILEGEIEGAPFLAERANFDIQRTGKSSLGEKD